MRTLGIKSIFSLFTPVNIFVVGSFLVLIAVIAYKPLINAFYPSERKRHDVAKITEGKVRIVQHGDILKGEKDPDSKVIMHIFPDRKKINLTVNNKGEWHYTIDNSFKERNYNLLVVYSDQQDIVERTRLYKIKVVSNREYYKKQKADRKENQAENDLEKDNRKACQKYEFYVCGSCDEELYMCQDASNIVKIKNSLGQCGTTSPACGGPVTR